MQKPLYRNRFPILLLIGVALASCTLRPRITPAPLILPTATQMAIVMPPAETTAPGETAVQAGPTLEPGSTFTPSATPHIIPDLPITITAQSVNLRQGPGTLFPSLGLLTEGTKVTASGKARGDDWIYVDTGKLQGWVSTAFTSLYQSDQGNAVPVKETGNAVLIHGLVSEAGGAPLAGIEFAAFQGNEASQPPDTRAHSLRDGSFYLYLPAGSKGVWRVSLTGVNCNSPIVDASCHYTGAFMPNYTDVTLPDENTVKFQYSK